MTEPEWLTFECEECGNVEDIDVTEAVAVPPCGCGGQMRCVDLKDR